MTTRRAWDFLHGGTGSFHYDSYGFSIIGWPRIFFFGNATPHCFVIVCFFARVNDNRRDLIATDFYIAFSYAAGDSVWRVVQFTGRHTHTDQTTVARNDFISFKNIIITRDFGVGLSTVHAFNLVKSPTILDKHQLSGLLTVFCLNGHCTGLVTTVACIHYSSNPNGVFVIVLFFLFISVYTHAIIRRS